MSAHALSQERPEQSTGAGTVLDTLRRMISEGMFPPGRRLPPERELAARLRVNRAHLRKALNVLAEEGTISRHVGRGTFVGRAAFGQDVPSGIGSVTPMELVEARIGLEPVIAGEAALRARQPDLRRLRHYAKRGDVASSYELFEEMDSALHRTIAEATQNTVYVMVTDNFGSMRNVPEWDRLKRLSLDDDQRAIYRRQHHAIVEAIAIRDPRQAASAMREHLNSVREALSAVGK